MLQKEIKNIQNEKNYWYNDLLKEGTLSDLTEKGEKIRKHSHFKRLIEKERKKRQIFRV